MTQFLEKKLWLKVNLDKSAVAHVEERKFLGYRLSCAGVVPKSVQRMKERVRAITPRNRGVGFARVVNELRAFLTGWLAYFRHARCRTLLQELDAWLRHRLRCYRLKQRKRLQTIRDFLHRLGVPNRRAWITALSGKGWWRLASAPSVHEAMNVQWFHEQGLISLVHHYNTLQR